VRTVDSAAIKTAIAAAASDLFPDLGAFGKLRVDSDPKGASVWVDGEALGIAPLIARVSAGTHAVEVRAKGHRPVREEIAIVLGQTAVLEAELSKNRSAWPLYMGGAAAAAGAAGLALGVTAQNVANDWKDACPESGCAAGFTAARYDDDDSSVAIRKNAANALYGVAGALAVGAIVYFFLDPGEDTE